MLYGQYNKPHTYNKLLTHPVWETALSWIQAHAINLPDGEHEIQNLDIYANIMSVTTLKPEDTFFEVHEEYIDIHYCLSGGEAIGYAPIGEPTEKELNKEKDYQLFLPTEKMSLCILQPHNFAVFFPTEPHMPKLQNGMDTTVKKVVIKIKKSMLEI
ncbi:MAG: YhcH/YjgK/YiaL family protein [Candidatus Andersenbacteria bacterium]|nr:YhcH/YjgK/YiaL family protein [Candidatus Andersenbacteria bacterium]